MTIAAFASILKLYNDTETAIKEIPTLRMLNRKKKEIYDTAKKAFKHMNDQLRTIAKVEIVDCKSQIGSGALPIDLLPSWGVSVVPLTPSDIRLQALNKKFRKLAVPIIGRVSSGRLILDFRCLDEPELFLEQIRSIGEATA